MLLSHCVLRPFQLSIMFPVDGQYLSFMRLNLHGFSENSMRVESWACTVIMVLAWYRTRDRI